MVSGNASLQGSIFLLILWNTDEYLIMYCDSITLMNVSMFVHVTINT